MNSVVPVLRSIQKTYCDDLNGLVQYMAELDPINWDEYELSVSEVSAALLSLPWHCVCSFCFEDRRRGIYTSSSAT